MSLPRPEPPSANLPVVASVAMGYGHLRAAHAIASALGLETVHVDRPPIAPPEEQRLWEGSRRFYEMASRASQLPGLGAPLRVFLDGLTRIPHLYPYRDLSDATLECLSLERLIKKGLGRGLAAHLEETGRPLLTTFYASAISADHYGCAAPIYCVVTDSDIHRIWAPIHPERSRIVYFTPTRRALKRLRAYGVPREQIELTGFPLPHKLLGGPDLPVLQRNLAARLVRLDRKKVFRNQTRNEIQHFLGDLPHDQEGRPPLATFTVGGAGAQANLARALLRSLKPLLEQGRLRLCLVAGVRQEIADKFHDWIDGAGLAGHLGPVDRAAVSVEVADSLDSYFPRFNQLLAETDILWTKPSEMTFFAALGIPLVLTPPVGHHERYNRRWAIENGGGLRQRHPDYAGFWIREWLAEGTLAATAWFGFLRFPKSGLYQILDRVGAPQPATSGMAAAPAREPRSAAAR